MPPVGLETWVFWGVSYTPNSWGISFFGGLNNGQLMAQEPTLRGLTLRLIAIEIGFVGTIDVYANIVGLLLGEGG